MNNREIKFRAQRSDNKEFVYGFYYKGKRADKEALEVPLSHARLFDSIITEDGTIYDILPSSLGQFTGLKDSKEKEIYEGDIISSLGGVSTVKYNEIFSGYFLNGLPSFPLSLFSDYKVIGNIHENPELLK